MQNRKTIIYICQFAGTLQNGMNYRPYYLGKYSVKAGYRFIVFGAGFHHQMKEPKNLTRRPVYETIDGIEYIWMPSKIYRAKSYIERVKSLFAFPLSLLFFNISGLVKNDEMLCIVSSSPNLLSSIPAMRWAKKLGTDFIFEVRDIWPMSLVELSGVTEKNPFVVFLKHIEKKSYRKARKVFSVLSNSCEYMAANGMDPSTFTYIPNGIDRIPDISNTSFQRNNRNKLFEGKFTIGYSGTIGVANNLSNLITAAKHLEKEKEILIVLVGDGPMSADIRKEADGLENVVFLPPVSKDEINELLKDLDAGYLGLKRGRMFEYGISPNKLFDYMLAGLPVILAVNTKNSIVKNAGCGVVLEPDNPEKLAEKILELYKMDHKELKVMGRRGLEYVLRNHTYEKITELFIKSITGEIG